VLQETANNEDVDIFLTFVPSLTLVVREPDLSGNRILLGERKPDGSLTSNVSACSET